MVSQKMGGAWVHELPRGGEIPTNKNMFSEEQTSMCLSHYSFWIMQLYQPIRTNIPTDGRLKSTIFQLFSIASVLFFLFPVF